MTHRIYSLLATTALLTGCGEAATAGANAALTNDRASALELTRSFGTVTATVTDVFITNGSPSYEFAVSLWKTPQAAPCARATKTVGACCYTPPPPPKLGSSGPLGTSPDGGPDFVMADAGGISIAVNAGAPLATLEYVPEPVGFGWAEGYSTADLNPPRNANGPPPDETVWQPGAVLTITAAGGADLAAFKASLRAVERPAVTFPAEVSRSHDLALGWALARGPTRIVVNVFGAKQASIACSAADADGAITISHELLAEFAPGDSLEGSTLRQSVERVPVEGGTIDVEARGETWVGFTLKP